MSIDKRGAVWGKLSCPVAALFIPVLMRAGHVKPLGRPMQNARNWFATCELERLGNDMAWVDKTIRTLER
jgi:hypothetical protein